jgi:hypothetical protein
MEDMIHTDDRFVNVQPGQRWSALHQAAWATGAESALCMCASLEPRHACTHLCVCFGGGVHMCMWRDLCLWRNAARSVAGLRWRARVC